MEGFAIEQKQEAVKQLCLRVIHDITSLKPAMYLYLIQARNHGYWTLWANRPLDAAKEINLPVAWNQTEVEHFQE